MIRSSTIALGLALAHISAAAVAQVAPDIRQGVDPSVLREQRERERLPRAQPVVPPAPAQLPAPAPDDVQFTLSAIAFEGLAPGMPDAADFAPDYAELVGKPTTLAAIEGVAARATARLRAAGAILAQAIVPPQDIDNGRVVIRVAQGSISTAIAEGDRRGRHRLVDAPLARIAAERPLQLSTLERNLLLIDDLPGVTPETVLQPDPATPAAAKLTTRLTHRSVDGYAAIDNRTSRLIGPWTVQAGLGFNSLLGGYERLDIAVAGTPDSSRLRYLQGRLAVPLATNGTRLELTADYTQVRPDLEKLDLGVLALGIEGWSGEIAIAHPFVRSRAANVIGRIAGEFIDTRSDEAFLGVPLRGTRERVRVLTAAISADWAGGGGVNYVETAINIGINGLGAVIDPAPIGVDPGFFFVTARLARSQPLGGDLAIYGEVVGQLSADGLSPSQRFNLGGARVGRGFAPASASGDSGLGGRVELRWSTTATTGQGIGWQAYGFGDYGFGVDKRADRDGQRREELASIGLGVRAMIGDHFTITPELSQQLAGRSADTAATNETRLMITAAGRF